MIIPDMTDILCVHVEGHEEYLTQIATSWQTAFSKQWQDNHGRLMGFQVITNQRIQFLFRPSGAKFATPSSLLKDEIVTRLLQVGLASSEQQADLPPVSSRQI